MKTKTAKATQAKAPQNGSVKTKTTKQKINLAVEEVNILVRKHPICSLLACVVLVLLLLGEAWGVYTLTYNTTPGVKDKEMAISAKDAEIKTVTDQFNGLKMSLRQEYGSDDPKEPARQKALLAQQVEQKTQALKKYEGGLRKEEVEQLKNELEAANKQIADYKEARPREVAPQKTAGVVTEEKSGDDERIVVTTDRATGKQSVKSVKNHRSYPFPKTLANLKKILDGDDSQDNPIGFDGKVWRFRDMDPADGITSAQAEAWAKEVFGPSFRVNGFRNASSGSRR